MLVILNKPALHHDLPYITLASEHEVSLAPAPPVSDACAPRQQLFQPYSIHCWLVLGCRRLGDLTHRCNLNTSVPSTTHVCVVVSLATVVWIRALSRRCDWSADRDGRWLLVEFHCDVM
ncbi:hypothetical protein RR46_03685 [Papilio xuthus]|uniref:Uncharacterized protein n=1 Tax=Papilio xuthus TaxID=66420 RepID=A0A194PZS0_PAPXU|nr:hypothetical protein RR46_03685 [Papilio xuthus]